MKSVGDTTTRGITCDSLSDHSRGVIYNLNIIIIHVSGDVFTDFCFILGLGMSSIILTSWQLSITNSSDGIRAPFKVRFNAGNPYLRDRLSTVNLLVLNSLDQLLLIMLTFYFFTKQITWTRRSTVLSFLLQLVFAGPNIIKTFLSAIHTFS
jgi:hypothetical protein